MTIRLTPGERKLVDHAKKAIVAYNRLRQSKGGIDTLYAFALSESGKIYDGACLESTLPQASVCAERHAIASMVLAESYASKLKSFGVADPVPNAQKNGTPPCGMCRHLIWERGTPATTVILLQYIRQYIRQGNRWTFPKIEKLAISKLYPRPYKPVQRD